VTSGAVPLDPSFEAEFERLFALAFRPALRILRSPEAAEDVAAEVLARAYFRWSRLRLGSVDGWIARSATNLSIDYLRRSGRRPVWAPHTAAAEGDDLRLCLASALASLPKRQREALTLHFFGDLTEHAVAQAMHISEGSVKTHIHRGLEKLRRQLGSSQTEGYLGN
jgi:RNA polymerase sigma factor (sigma-70 family)